MSLGTKKISTNFMQKLVAVRDIVIDVVSRITMKMEQIMFEGECQSQGSDQNHPNLLRFHSIRCSVSGIRQP